MGTKLLFWLIFYPLSLLPLRLLYAIAYIFYLISHYLIIYRRKVITDNLQKSFPEKSIKEIAELRRLFYYHLAHIAAEMMKMLTISQKELKKRYYCTNPELVNKYYDEGRSVILVSSHYNNWEWMVLSLNSQFKHHGVGVGAPNSNKVFEKMINYARTRYGTEVVFADTVREEFAKRDLNHILTSYMMLTDQSPAHSDKCYVTSFLNQPSGILYGAEYFAKKYNLPVLYYQVIKDKMGYYHIDVELITDTPKETGYGEITEKYIKLLEKTICQKPEYWLWSHRRWKYTYQLPEKKDND